MTIINEKTGKVKISSRGGARPNAGRQKGSSNKLSGQKILESLENIVGKDYASQLAENYMTAMVNMDKDLVLQYDKLFLSKVVADKVEVDLHESEDMIAAKKDAFTEALTTMIGLNNVKQK